MLHDAQSRTYGLKAQVGVIGGVLPGFVTGIHVTFDVTKHEILVIPLTYCLL